MTVSTHVLDAMTGRPAAGVAVSLSFLSGEWVAIGAGSTDADGRHRFGEPTGPGVYRLTFGTGSYFALLGVRSFYPEVTITFEVFDSAARYHVPLLLSPFAYSTYRGS